MKATKKQTRGKDEKCCIIQNLFMPNKKILWRETKSKFVEVLVPSSKYMSDQN